LSHVVNPIRLFSARVSRESSYDAAFARRYRTRMQIGIFPLDFPLIALSQRSSLSNIVLIVRRRRDQDERVISIRLRF